MNLSDFFPSVLFFNPDVNTDNSITTLNPVMNITFNTDIDYTQVSTTTELNKVIYLIEESTKRYIPLTFVSYSSKSLVLTTSGSLSPGLFYQLTVLNTLRSEQGRTSTNNRSFAFQAKSSDLSTPVLVAPADNTSITSIPMFVWNTITNPGTGSLTYRIQIDKHLEFNANEWSTTTSLASAYPGISFSIGETYYWRVSATYTSTAGSSISAFSSINSFYFGSSDSPSPETQQTYEDVLAFEISRQSILNGLSNQATFPSLIFTFNTAISSSTVTSSTLLFTKESVDGYPNGNKTNVGCTYTFSNGNKTITITPTDNIVQNSRYSIVFTSGILNTNGDSLESFTTYFTSRYSPLYVGLNVIRANFGRFLIPYSDDLLNFYIFRESLNVNREFIFYYSSWTGGPVEDQVRNFIFTLTYPMEKYVECKVSERLLTNRYYELLENAGSNQKLADFSIEQGYNILGELNGQIKFLRQESLKYSAEFSRHKAIPRTTVKSSNWPQNQKYTDMSFNRQIRTGKF